MIVYSYKSLKIAMILIDQWTEGNKCMFHSKQ